MLNLQGWNYYPVGRDKAVEEMMDGFLANKTGLRDAQIVVFLGGVDISPTMYFEFERHACTQEPDMERDRIERSIFDTCIRTKKTIVGICRGAQLVNILNGGRLWQHVDGHTASNHSLTYVDSGGQRFIIPQRGDHHQMMIPLAETGKVIGYVKKSTFRCSGKDSKKRQPDEIDPEIVIYPVSKSLCFQPHPEWSLPTDTIRNVFVDCIKRTMIGA